VARRRQHPRTQVGASRDAWPALALLAEPRRREVYDFVATRDEPVTREEVSAGVPMTRPLAAFHLDKLAEAGLLDVTFSRPEHRSGPGAGRPSKRYAVSSREVDVSLPPRRYDVAGRVMARAIAESTTKRSQTAAQIAKRLAREEGREVGEQYVGAGRASTKRTLAAVEEALASCGYEPAVAGQTVKLRNCPFHSLVDAAPQLVCELNESFVSGVIDGLDGAGAVEAELCGRINGNCCVVVRTEREHGRSR
jgi:predicted ArsR family transcriptional regulator